MSWELIRGPIGGLRLPWRTWQALRREDITTLHRLRAWVDQLHTIPDIGPKTAQLIREELARAESLRKMPNLARALPRRSRDSETTGTKQAP